MFKQATREILGNGIAWRDMPFTRKYRDYELIYFYPPTRVLHEMGPDSVYDKAFAQSQANHRRSIYVHIPFCTGRCNYCHYARFTCSAKAQNEFERYMTAIKNEIKLLEKTFPPGQIPFYSVHFGGGTPTILSARHTIEIMAFLRSRLNVSQDAEVTWEATPETLLDSRDSSKLQAMLESGVNRLSIGVQSFEDDLLKMMGRRYRSNKTIEAIEKAHQVGFENVNIDLIYGLPDQTLNHWKRTLDMVGHLRPESVTCYQLRVKNGTPISKVESSRFPEESLCWDMGCMMLEKLNEFDYKPWQPNQFVLEDKYVHQYLKSKWEGQSDVLGLGVSAYSFVNNCMYVNHRTLAEYYESIRAGRLPIWVGKKLSWEQQVAKAIVLGIKVLPNGVDKDVFAERFGIRLEDFYADTIWILTSSGLIESTPQYLRLTNQGLLLADEVCAEFYADEDKEFLKKTGATRYGSYFDPVEAAEYVAPHNRIHKPGL